MLQRGFFLATLLAFTGAQAQTYTAVYKWQTSDYDWNPNPELIVENGSIIGTMKYNAAYFENPNDTGCGGYGCGSVFRLTASGVATLHAFLGADGGMPIGGVIDVGGTLYGTTSYGGKSCGVVAEHCGTIFGLKMSTGKLTTLYNFSGGADGGGPYGKLLNFDGLLYGTTAIGGQDCGSQGCGTIFQLDSTTRVLKTLYRFSVAYKTGHPESGLTQFCGILYGTTEGDTDYGTVFSFNPLTNDIVVLHRSAAGSDGYFPSSDLLAYKGALYGTTLGGGSAGYGTLFKLNLALRTETIIHAFTGFADGSNPNGSLAMNDGVLYGTTQYSYGPYAFSAYAGILYSFNLDTDLAGYRFDFSFYPTSFGTTGQFPSGLFYSNGLLYGVTESGVEFSRSAIKRISHLEAFTPTRPKAPDAPMCVFLGQRDQH